MHRATERRLALATALAAVALAGCGGSDDDSSESGETAKLENPTRPAAADCATDALATSAKPDYLVPKAGNYRYAMQGTRKTLAQESVSSPLPRQTQFVFTPTLSEGNLRCYRTQRRYAPDVADTTTFTVRGSDVYVTNLDVFTRGKTFTVKPEPPIKVLDGDDFEWGGSFSGPTNGRYQANVLGRRAMQVGGKRERAVGVQIRLSFAGDLRGTARTVTWFSMENNLPLLETSKQDRDVAGLRLGIEYEARLEGLSG